MADETPRFALGTYAQGDENWSHTDTVETLDELAVDRGPISDRPATGNYDDEMYYAIDQRTLWRWDEAAGDWQAAAGLGTADSPVPGTTHLEAVSTERTVIGSDGQTTSASAINTAIQNAQPGDVIQFAGQIDGQVVIDKDINLIGSGVSIREEATGPFTAKSVNGAIIDNTGNSGPALKIQGFRGGITAGNFGLKADGHSLETTAESTDGHDMSLFWSTLRNIVAYDVPSGSYAFKIRNPFKVTVDNCHALRTAGGFHVLSNDDPANDSRDYRWHPGHVNFINTLVDVSKSGLKAYHFESVTTSLDYIRLWGTHAISEGRTTSDFTGYRFDSVRAPEMRGVTAEGATDSIIARGTEFTNVPNVHADGNIDDNIEQLYLTRTGTPTAVGSAILRNFPVSIETPQSFSFPLNTWQQNGGDAEIFVSAIIENDGGPIDAVMDVSDSETELRVAQYKNDNSPTSHRATLQGRVPMGAYYQIQTFNGGESLLDATFQEVGR